MVCPIHRYGPRNILESSIVGNSRHSSYNSFSCSELSCNTLHLHYSRSVLRRNTTKIFRSAASYYQLPLIFHTSKLALNSECICSVSQVTYSRIASPSSSICSSCFSSAFLPHSQLKDFNHTPLSMQLSLLNKAIA